MYFDTHAHYTDEAFEGDRDALLAVLPARGVGLVLCPATDVASARACIALAEKYAHVYAAVGIHPLDANEIQAGDLDEIEVLAAHAKVRAIGEIGLDYFYEDAAPHDVQQSLFRTQLALAEKLQLPVVVHDREAHGDCLAIVREFPAVRGVYHCYSGGLEDAKTLVGLGWSLSFTGAITFKNARRALDVLAWLPKDRFFLETDAPYLAPVPFRGKRNDSAYLYRMAETIAQVRGSTADEIAALTAENGKRFFGIA